MAAIKHRGPSTTSMTNATIPVTTTVPAALLQQERTSVIPPPRFWFGGAASCLATLVSHPFDLVKVRIQTYRGRLRPTTESHLFPMRMFNTMWRIARVEGPLALYKGLSASVLRQGTYSTIRFGVYDKLKWTFAGDGRPTYGQLLICSTTAGLVGGAFGNPWDIVNVRMQHDGQLPPSQRRNYRHVVDGMIRICRDEGPRVLLRGIGPSTQRAVLITVSQMTSYDMFKDMLSRRLGNVGMVHFGASVLAGLVATTVCAPLDVVKTRIMSAHLPDKRHQIPIMVDMVRTEGIGSLFRGWTPAFIRLGPHTIATFLLLEQFRHWQIAWTPRTK